ncbi:hypothetical protein ACGFOU_36095, partial [Streptomyces sp. NPDC048595]
PDTGRIRTFRQRGEVPQLASRAHQGLRDSPYAGPDLITRILHQLPTGYALLFGRACARPPATVRTPSAV